MNKKQEEQRSVPEGHIRKRVSFRLVGSFVDVFPEEWSDRRIIESVSGPLNNLTIESPFEGKEEEVSDGHRFSIELDEVTDISYEEAAAEDGERKVVIQPPCSLEQMMERTRALQQKHREEEEKFWRRFYDKQQQ